MSSYYAFLGIAQTSSVAEIENALQRRSLEINPTAINEAELTGPSRSHWRVLQMASATLTDPIKRSTYDAALVPHRPSPASPARSIQASVSSPQPPLIPSRQSPPTPSASSKSSYSCPNCDAQSDGTQLFCLVCGTDFKTSKSSSANVYAGQLTTPHSHVGQPERPVSETFFRLFGWRKVRGTIVTAEAPYTVDNEFILWRFLVKIGFFVFLAWLIYEWASQNMFAVLIGGALVLLVAILAAGIFCMLFGHFIGFLLSAKLFGKEKQIQVRDVRLRDTQLQEHVVRFRGELRAGQVAVGDEIEIWGKNRGGTIMARRGYNFRTNTRISVKYR